MATSQKDFGLEETRKRVIGDEGGSGVRGGLLGGREEEGQ